MFRRELGIWRRLKHDNIVPFLGITYGFGMDGTTSLVSLWMSNESLHKFLAKYDGHLNIVHRLQFLLDISNGLHYLHSLPIIHGDLNCNNILLDEGYTARLADFGYASLVGDIPEALGYLQRSTARPGALRWITPEQIDPDETLNRSTKSDIYSFGCVALQGSSQDTNSRLILSGKRPWSEVREDAAVVLRLAKGHKPGRPESRAIDDSHWNLIQDCWSSVEDRPTTKVIISNIQRFLSYCTQEPPLSESLASTSIHTDSLDHGLPSSLSQATTEDSRRNLGMLDRDKRPYHAPSVLTRNQSMISDQTSSSSSTDWFSSTSHSSEFGDNHSPSLGAASLPLSTPDIASSSQPYPPIHLGSGIPNRDVVHGVTSSDHHSSIDENDIVIALMGPVGSGKSSFVNTAAGKTVVGVNDLRSQTRAVQSVRCLHPDGRRNIVLVDTPGFDDTHLSDGQILRIMAHWLKETYRNNVKLAGLLYLHRISDMRFAGTPLRNLAVFKDLCGDGNLKNIVLVTTMWDEVEDQAVGSQREDELLSDFWKVMIRQGSRSCRFEGTRDSAWEIINRLDLEGSRQMRIPPPPGPAGSICSANGHRDALVAAIKVLRVAHQAADICHIPMLRGVIGTVLHIAQQIEKMGGTHHAISQVIQSSGWLLDEITQYAATSRLSKDMNRTLASFQRELHKLQKVVTKVSSRGPVARFLLHDADIEAITACTTSIKAVYDKLGLRLAMDSSQAIARLEDHVAALREATALRKCECGMFAVLHEALEENGQPSASTNQSF
ncbi:kinase-like protein [Imleria badia]|nr:kinase-like protein [Imleria badia]